MIDLAPLLAPPSAAAPAPVAAEEARLDEIISLSDHNQLAEAAAAAQSAWLAGMHDVRILGFFLAGAYVQDGLRALPLLPRALNQILDAQWPGLAPVQNKERYADGALRWLFTTIMNQLRFFQRAGKEGWQTTLQDWAALPQSELLSLLEATAERIAEVTGQAGAKSAALSLVGFLKRLPQAASLAAATTSAGPDGGTVAGGTDESTARAAEKHDHATTPEGAATALLSVPLSPAMQRLLRKLDAFGRLVNLGKFRHAAIVYKDIQASLTGFDPRQYFPSLFGEYYGHVVTHADKITKHIGEDKGFLADALKELYQTDLELFVSSKG